ncbi:proton-activated chloride channel [Latimeria chalumnae]|uniref:Proton-activated chloride channel n=1 Tax=Latimeria chalumnae TaxID=7897 RepID=H3A087_LATCH|nr:PREDICTED: transmembrane protein 206 [Latimeria chalumnae]|eukprot:XP_006013353.1 PREDICTED: transmembrane protein 206 [Latimeria chalumnae]
MAGALVRQELRRSYQELEDEEDRVLLISELEEEEKTEEVQNADTSGSELPEDDARNVSTLVRFSKTCLKNFLSGILILIYLLLAAVAGFLAYQTITDFRRKLNHPVMSVSYKEVLKYDAPGIALYPGKAQLLSCKHHYHDHMPPIVNSGKPEEIECRREQINYVDPFTNHTSKYSLLVRGPSDVRKKELVFLQFSLNETKQDFSAISYLLFSSFQEFLDSPDKAQFMKDCERSYSVWTFSGGFRTWIKMSLIKTTEKDGSQSIEFMQESSVVKYNDRRPVLEQKNELFFIVFEWKDSFIQEVRSIVTANPWSTIGILCGVFLFLFKAADFAKLSVKWMIKIRKRQLKVKAREMNIVT